MKCETYYVNLLIIGDNYVGKSTFMKRIVGKSIDNVKVGSNGGEVRQMRVGKDKIRTLIYDSDGTPGFCPSLSNFVRCANGIMLLYTINRRQSFENLPKWVDFLHENSLYDCTVTLVGCKSDREDARQVSTEEGKYLAGRNNMNFLETSAVTGENVESAFRITAISMYAKLKKCTEDQVIEMHEKNELNGDDNWN